MLACSASMGTAQTITDVPTAADTTFFSISDDDNRVTVDENLIGAGANICLLYTSPSPRDGLLSRMPSSA